MPLAALGLALAAALLHASWNVLLAGASDTRAATGGLLAWGVVLLAAPAFLGGGLPVDALPYAAASAALELAYFLLLARAYAGGEVSVVYPVARGLAPALVLVGGAAVLREEVPALAAAGVLAVGAGVVLLGLGGFRGRDVLFGVAIAAVIASYTLVDAEGVERARPAAYLLCVVAPCAVAYPALVRTRPDLGARSAVMAAATFGAFLLVLAALRLAPAAPVAAVRESSVVFAALMAAAFLGEPVGRWRLAGAAVVAVGVAAIAYS